jgi:Major tropism determinant N-terminal domain
MTTTQLQLRRDTAANIAGITPAQGEPIYDVTNGTLRVGDGATAGGSMLAGPYAFGTWTPTLAGAGTAGSPTYTIQSGSYERIGRLVVCRFTVAISALGGMAGNVEIGGLPFAAASVSNDSGGGPATALAGVTFDSGYTQAALQVNPGNAYAGLVEHGSNKTTQAIAAANLAATSEIAAVLIYHV